MINKSVLNMIIRTIKKSDYESIIELVRQEKGDKWTEPLIREINQLENIKNGEAGGIVCVDKSDKKKILGILIWWKSGHNVFISWLNARMNNSLIIQKLIERIKKTSIPDEICITHEIERDNNSMIINLLSIGFRISGLNIGRYSKNAIEVLLSYENPKI